MKKIKNIQKSLTAVIRKEEKYFIAECPEIGTVSQGITLDEAVSNLKEATELYLEEFPPKVIPRTYISTFEAAINA